MDTDTIAEGAGWRVFYDSDTDTSWLSVDNMKALNNVCKGNAYETLEVMLPEELADLIDTAWRSRTVQEKPVDLHAAVLSIFTQSRWGVYSAEGVLRIAHGAGTPSVNVLPNIGAATEQAIRSMCEQLVDEGLLCRHFWRLHTVYELNREKFPVEEK